MALLRFFPQKGWRRTGCINIALELACGILLSICLIVSLKQHGSSIDTATIIFEGKCSKTSSLNTVLHLLMNILSAGILASSNFFMQIASAPSRNEIDKAHTFLQSLEIGIPSFKNIQFVSYFKRACWLVLFLSSLPVHLFFNSSVFETGFQGSDWHLTIGTEAFTQGADFSPPGASLAPAGSPHPSYHYDDNTQSYIPDNYTDKYFYDRYEYRIGHGYGEPVTLEQYANRKSDVRQNITWTAANAGEWNVLHPNACRAEYLSCKPRSQYRDVVLVIESGTGNAVGWSRQEVFNLTQDLSLLWDAYVPQKNINSLWYSTQCKTTKELWGKDCENTCGYALGSQVNIPQGLMDDSTPLNWVVSFQNLSQLQIPPGQEAAFGFNYEFSNLTVKYCLVEPHPSRCKIGLSNLLLMIVIICISIKITQGSVILWKLQQTSLVTPGDAMESFITKPSLQTAGLGTLDMFDSQQLEIRPRRYWSPEDESLLTSATKPRRWLPISRRLLSIIPRTAWARMYGLSFLSMVVLVVCLIASYTSNEYSL